MTQQNYYVTHANLGRGNSVIIELCINTSQGLRKPELIIIEDTFDHVLDAQIMDNDNHKLEYFNKNKIS